MCRRALLMLWMIRFPLLNHLRTGFSQSANQSTVLQTTLLAHHISKIQRRWRTAKWLKWSVLQSNLSSALCLKLTSFSINSEDNVLLLRTSTLPLLECTFSCQSQTSSRYLHLPTTEWEDLLTWMTLRRSITINLGCCLQIWRISWCKPSETNSKATKQAPG